MKKIFFTICIFFFIDHESISKEFDNVFIHHQVYNKINIIYYKIPQNKGVIRIVSPRFEHYLAAKSPSSIIQNLAPDGSFILDMVDYFKPDALISGGYLSSLEPPIGLGGLKISERTLQPIHHSWLTNGIFCSSGTTWMIRDFVDKDDFYNDMDCLQAGPILLQNGYNRYHDISLIDPNERKLALSLQDQAFLCTNNYGDLLMGFASGGTTKDLANLSKIELGCLWTLRLSGSITAGLWTSSRGLDGHNEVRLTNGIAAFSLETIERQENK
ncbi:hypothetical protein P7L79_03595 (plasmid) [Tistrella mobilis]|uniref:hypothetical protein n=1 Tax=Tistrella mobilis TaxID=171437 RepID=UPI003555CDBE